MPLDPNDPLLQSLSRIPGAQAAPAPMPIAAPAPIMAAPRGRKPPRMTLAQKIQALGGADALKSPEGLAALSEYGLVPKAGVGQINTETRNWLGADQDQNRVHQITNYALPRQTALDMADFINENPMEGARAARSATEGVKDQIGKIQQMPLRMQGVDLRPLAGMLDTWFGGDRLKATEAPETAQDRSRLLISLQEKLADNAAKQQHFESQLFGHLQPKQLPFVDMSTMHKAQEAGGTVNKNDFHFSMEPPKAGKAGDDDIHKQVHEYEAGLEKAGLTPFMTALGDMKSVLDKYGGKPPGPLDRVTGMIPGGYVGASDYNQALTRLLQARETAAFGKRITQLQLQQATRGLGSGALSSPELQVQGIKAAANLLRQEMQAHEADAFSGKKGPAVQAYIQANPGMLKSSQVPDFGAPVAPIGGGAMSRKDFLQQYGSTK